jgi:hypothetical protein
MRGVWSEFTINSQKTVPKMQDILMIRYAGGTSFAPNNHIVIALNLSYVTGTRALRSGEMLHNVEKYHKFYYICNMRKHVSPQPSKQMLSQSCQKKAKTNI